MKSHEKEKNEYGEYREVFFAGMTVTGENCCYHIHCKEFQVPVPQVPLQQGTRAQSINI